MDNTNPISSLQHLAELLRTEMQYEQEAYARSLTDGFFATHVNDPACHFPVTLGTSDYNALDQLVLTLRCDFPDEETESDF